MLSDPLPAGVTYEPGSLEILSGANAGAMTGAADDDQAEYVAVSHSVVARLGDGANTAQGGSLGIDAATALRFRVKVGAACPGPSSISNQASISATGELSGEQNTYVTDGNGAAAGSPPTIIISDVRCLTVGTDGTGSGTVTSAPIRHQLRRGLRRDACQQQLDHPHGQPQRRLELRWLERRCERHG